MFVTNSIGGNRRYTMFSIGLIMQENNLSHCAEEFRLTENHKYVHK